MSWYYFDKILCWGCNRPNYGVRALDGRRCAICLSLLIPADSKEFKEPIEVKP